MEEQEQTIDLRVLLKVLQEHLLPIVLITIVTSVLGFFLAAVIIPKKYTSEALMYVENSASKTDDSAININDINAAQKLVNTCQILFTSNYVLDELRVAFNDRYSVGELREMISITSVNNTEVLKISVVSGSPQESYDVTVKLAELSTKEFTRVIKNGSIETVSAPTYPIRHTYPSTIKFTAIAFMIGLAGSYFIFVVLELLDVKVKPEDDLAELYNIPVFAEILDFTMSNGLRYKQSKYGYGKYGYYENGYGYGYSEEETAKEKSDSQENASGQTADKRGADKTKREKRDSSAAGAAETEKMPARMNSGAAK